jgi:hypothetical protein
MVWGIPEWAMRLVQGSFAGDTNVIQGWRIHLQQFQTLTAQRDQIAQHPKD